MYLTGVHHTIRNSTATQHIKQWSVRGTSSAKIKKSVILRFLSVGV